MVTGLGRKGRPSRSLGVTCCSFPSKVVVICKLLEADHFSFCFVSQTNLTAVFLYYKIFKKPNNRNTFILYVLPSTVQNEHKHQSIISIVYCSQGFKTPLMDANSCGVNTWRPEDNDDCLMNWANHCLASLTHSIFPLALQPLLLLGSR